VLADVQHGQKRIRVRLLAVDLDRRAEQRLREDQVGQRGQVEQLRVGVEQLAQETLEAVEVDVGVRVEPFEVDVYKLGVLLIALISLVGA
jgi:hypothetical protein